jgi:hypothetical protein
MGKGHQLRLLVLASNKKNMRQYRNQRAERVKSQQWFYNFCLRLLLERVTHFCYEHATSQKANGRLLKIIYSERGGHSYGQTIAYHELLKNQSKADALVLTKRRIFWEVLDWRLAEAATHKSRPDLFMRARSFLTSDVGWQPGAGDRPAFSPGSGPNLFCTRWRNGVGDRAQARSVTDRAGAARQASCGRDRLRGMPRRTQGGCGSRSRRHGRRFSRDEDAASRTRRWPIPGSWERHRAR